MSQVLPVTTNSATTAPAATKSAKKTAAGAAQRNEVIPVPSPAQVRVPGFYPASYRIAWDEKSREYHIALTDLTRRD